MRWTEYPRVTSPSSFGQPLRIGHISTGGSRGSCSAALRWEEAGWPARSELPPGSGVALGGGGMACKVRAAPGRGALRREEAGWPARSELPPGCGVPPGGGGIAWYPVRLSRQHSAPTVRGKQSGHSALRRGNAAMRADQERKLKARGAHRVRPAAQQERTSGAWAESVGAASIEANARSWEQGAASGPLSSTGSGLLCLPSGAGGPRSGTGANVGSQGSWCGLRQHGTFRPGTNVRGHKRWPERPPRFRRLEWQ